MRLKIETRKLKGFKPQGFYENESKNNSVMVWYYCLVDFFCASVRNETKRHD